MINLFEQVGSALGSAKRMASNAIQGVSEGAAPQRTKRVEATVAPNVSTVDSVINDWRVSLTVPPQIAGGPVLEPLSNTREINPTTGAGQTSLGGIGITGNASNSVSGRMIFPFTPVIMMSQRANYQTVDVIHANYPFQAYQNSQIDDITITGDFYVENEQDARYWIACVHFLRSMTKMFYGNGSNLGSPPPMSRLNGYGKHVLNDIPVVISNFTVDLQSEVDYIPCTVPGAAEPDYVPTYSTIMVVCTPNYARRSHAKFNLREFANGSNVGGPEGFV